MIVTMILTCLMPASNWLQFIISPVAQLRRIARVTGLPRALSRSGRRAQLLEALAAA